MSIMIERLEAQAIWEPNSGCLLWLGRENIGGYAVLAYEGADVVAHRVMWIETHGPIPDGLLVCHKCDVRCCINEAHLFLGTYADNSADMVRKSRQFRKVSDADFVMIPIWLETETQQQVADRLGIARCHVSALLKRWWKANPEAKHPYECST